MGKAGWVLGTHTPSSPSEAPSFLSNSQPSASHPHQQPPQAAWELQEVDIEQKRHRADKSLLWMQIFGSGLCGGPGGSKTPRQPYNRCQPGPGGKGENCQGQGLGSKEIPPCHHRKGSDYPRGDSRLKVN